MVKQLRRIALTSFGCHLRQLLIGDNLGICLSFERSRSKDYELLTQIRQFSAYCLARDIHVAVRWVPSEFNASDEPSRDWEPKLLDSCVSARRNSEEVDDQQNVLKHRSQWAQVLPAFCASVSCRAPQENPSPKSVRQSCVEHFAERDKASEDFGEFPFTSGINDPDYSFEKKQAIEPPSGS